MAQGRMASAAEASRASDAGDTMCLTLDSGTGIDCPTAEEMEVAIREILGHPFRAHGTCDTTVAASIRPDAAGGWRVDLHFASRTGDSLGDRSLETPDAACAALKGPLSLVIALMVEGHGAESTAFHLPKPLAPRPTVTSTGSRTAAYVGGTVSSGLLPHVGFGATIGFASDVVGGVPLRFDTTFWFPREQELGGPGGQFWAWHGSVGFCPSLFQTRYFGGSACLRGIAGLVRGVGLGLGEVKTATRPYGAGELSATVSVRLARQASVYLSVGVEAPWVRARFVYVGQDGVSSVLVHQPQVLIPLAGLGIEFDSEEPRRGVGKQ